MNLLQFFIAKESFTVFRYKQNFNVSSLSTTKKGGGTSSSAFSINYN
jgi:hypothetical protein